VCEQQTVAEFSVSLRRCLNTEGEPLGKLPEFARDATTMKRLYCLMALTRQFDEQAVAFQRTGRLGTFASSLGEEATTVAVGVAMSRDDVLLPSFREQGAMFARGVTPEELFLYWGGDERGSNFSQAIGDFPISIPVGSHAPHAAGVALAFKLKKEPRVAVCVIGDGATSKGEVYEAMNLAGVWNLPVVFVVLNNQWAISVPRQSQTRAETLAQKAIAAGFEGIQVDGNDIVAIYATLTDALTRSRAGEGPCLIEALTYRLTDHTTADDASRYRDDSDVSFQWQSEPIRRCRQYLVNYLGWSRDDEEQLILQTAQKIKTAAEAYLSAAAQPATSMFEYLYETLPTALKSQRDQLSNADGEADGG
jgi:pyruvate dehydrogenase E1 component alpha subunit